MLQLHLSLNLLNNFPICVILRLSELPAPVQGLCVLVPVQEPRQLPTAEVRGGPARALLCGGAQPIREPLTSPSAVNGAQNPRGGAEREDKDRGYTTEGGENSKGS